MKPKKFNNNARWKGYSKKNIDIANDSFKETLELHCYKLKIITPK